MLNIAMLVALDKAEELELHLDGAIRNGVTKKEIGEILLHSRSTAGIRRRWRIQDRARIFREAERQEAARKKRK